MLIHDLNARSPAIPSPSTLQSVEDRELKERLMLAVERLQDPEQELVKAALELIRKELREATSSMTSVPKPMKFLSPHFVSLKATHAALPSGDNKRASLAAVPLRTIVF